MNFFGSINGPFNVLPFSRSSQDIHTDPDARLYNIQTADNTYAFTFYNDKLWYLWYSLKSVAINNGNVIGDGAASHFRRTCYVNYDNENVLDTPATHVTSSPSSPGFFVRSSGTLSFFWDFSSTFSYTNDSLGIEGTGYGYPAVVKFPYDISGNTMEFAQEDLATLSWFNSPTTSGEEPRVTVLERYWDMDYTQSSNNIVVTLYPVDPSRFGQTDGLVFVYQVKVGTYTTTDITFSTDNVNSTTSLSFTLPSGLPLSPVEFFSNTGDLSVAETNRFDYWVSPFRIKT